MTKRKWTDFEKWATGITVTVFIIGSVLVPIFVPEVRVWLHLAKPSTVPAVTLPVPPISQRVVPPPLLQKPNVAQPPKIKAKGNNNVEGNSVAGMSNLTQGPGSIAQIGGSGNQATIIGAVPPSTRRLSDEEVNRLKASVSGHPFRILILYVQNNEEAFGLAKQIGDALSVVGWTLKQPVTGAMIMSEGGGPLYGMQLSWQGDAAPAGTGVRLDPATPWGSLGRELMRDFPGAFYVQPSPGGDKDSIMLEVFANPKSRPVSQNDQ